jgi:alpha-mannosidase
MLIPKCQSRIEQYLKLLERRRYEHILDLPLEVAETRQMYRTVPHDVQWSPVEFPFSYDNAWVTYWFRTTFQVPEQAVGRELYLHFAPQAECLVFVNGKPVSAINAFHEKMKLADSAKPGETFALALEMYSGHPIPGMHPFETPYILKTCALSGAKQAAYPFTIPSPSIAAKRQDLNDLYYNAWVLFDLAVNLPDQSLRKHRILQDLFYSLSGLRFTADDDTFEQQAVQANARIKPLLELKNSPTVPNVYAIGHAHIDHAWLWPIRETHRKVARTFACMSAYAKEFPEFRFIQSQPAQLETLKMQYPDIFAQVKQAYDAGQWEPNGGMYVEADCNIPQGESLIRQFLIGRLTTQDLLGYCGDTLWLPDVFGYAANLPQIMEGCEIDYFVTSKINWNDTTRFPYDTFLWTGIDGTGVNTHYITARKPGGYNGKLVPEFILDLWHQVQHKEVQSGAIMPIGEGDGGGGTMRADLEIARRVRNLEGCPKTAWTPVSEALQAIFQEARDLPEWQGELYLEMHRGTYTSQANTKWWNRKLEYQLRDAEMLSTLTMPVAYQQMLPDEDGLPYPTDMLLAQWKEVLIQQFHDILPGSSIQAVYEDAMVSYKHVHTQLTALQESRHAALQALFDTSLGEQPILAWNSLSWDRIAKITLPLQGNIPEACCLTSAGGQRVPAQLTESLNGERECVAFVSVPAIGGEVYYLESQEMVSDKEKTFSYDGVQLETPFYQVTFDSHMRITHLIDKATRTNYVQPGMAINTLQIAEDIPLTYDAWDIDVDYQLKLQNVNTLISSKVISTGPYFLQIRNQYSIGNASKLTQDVFWYSQHKRIDFVTTVDWQEEHQLLKVLFPTPIRSETVRCEIQYGHVQRPTHRNTQADRAMFEFCAHKWVALDNGHTGVALLNDCKYGYDVQGGNMRLTLLKSAKAPDPTADMGTHEFTYAFLPYQGAFTVENVVRHGYDLNVPVSAVPVERHQGAYSACSFFRVDNPNIILEVVKKAEGEDAIILRLYEASGSAQQASVETVLPMKKTLLTNMLEQEQKEIAFREGCIPLAFRDFEIKTLKILL